MTAPDVITGQSASLAGRLKLADFAPRDAEVPCAFYDPDLWFCEDSEDPQVIAQGSQAKLICQTECPFAASCLDYALATSQPFGIWGGLDSDERRKLTGDLAGPRRCARCARTARSRRVYCSDQCRDAAREQACREAGQRRRIRRRTRSREAVAS
jgi:WhiB family redox-sensing transcriptional regulator